MKKVKKFLSVFIAVCCLMGCFVITSSAYTIQNNGFNGINIDINSGHYQSLSQVPTWGQYAYTTSGCAWFASARAKELTGKNIQTIYSGYSWYNSAYSYFGFSRGNTPVAKSLACYENHVAVVEQISGNVVTISEGGYGSGNSSTGYCTIRNISISELQSGYSGTGSLLGYVYLGVGDNSSPSYFTSVWADGITENDATIHATIYGTNLSTCGFYIGKSESAMKKRTETVNGYVENIWYTLSSDYGTLQPGTTYYYKFFVTVGGTEYCSDVKTFKTSGKTYTLSYDANGGSGAPVSQTGTDWATMTVSSTKPTRTGYTFLGWSEYKKDTTAPYLPGCRFLITKNITLYAVWEANTYSVKYNANGGSGTMSNSSHTYDVSNELTSNVFTRSGYTFLGWSTSSTATSATYTDGQSVKNLTATNGGTVNLYGVWQKNPVTISSISIATKPTKTEYYVGDTFNSSGLSIKVTMSDGTTQTLTSGFTVSSPNMSTVGTKTVTVTYSGKTASFTINVNEKPVTPENPDTDYTISIRTPSRTTIRHNDGIILHANIEGELPEGAQVTWYVSNDNFDGGYLDDGMSCVFVSKNNGYTTIYAVIEDANGNELAVDSIELRSKAGFFDKIGGFFRSLFGSTTIYEY